jgi:glycosyltransferase involved in cell wall biosynthesis
MLKSNNKIDLLFVTHRHKVAGGAEKALLDMLQYLKSLDFKIHVVVGSTGNFVTELKRLGIPFSIIFQPYWAHSQQDPSPFHFTSLNPTVNTTLQLVELINKLQPKLCVTNTIVVPWLAYASSLTSTPHAWMIHELGTAGLDLRYAIGENQTLKNIDALSDIIFFNSKYTSEYYRPHLSEDVRVEIVYPGGNTPQPNKISSVYRKTSLKLIAVGQIKPQKGQFDAVKAVKALRDDNLDAELILVGLKEDKVYTGEIERYVKLNQLENSVKFAGHQANPASYVKQADIALVTSTNDAFGRVTVEAMLQSKPVIAAASAGSLEIINDEKTGLFYTPGNHLDLAKKIKELADHPELGKTLGLEAKKIATNLYNEKSRYASFVKYVRSLPETKHALDLKPLQSVLIDFRSTIDLLDATNRRLESIESSRIWGILQKLKQIIKR